ncbi:ferrous iron transport protein A, partial [Mycobacterium rufum]|nr:ferrous iron transport protein A [Mycolicibacterium rufum]
IAPGRAGARPAPPARDRTWPARVAARPRTRLASATWRGARRRPRDLLRYFDTVGISLDSHVRVVARRDFAGMISVAVRRPGAGGAAEITVDLGSPAAEAIWVVA